MTATLHASQLATPPQPPFPRLERPLSPDELEQALRSFQGSYYVEHPFHKLMRLICESYVTFCRTKPWVQACASSLTELFAPKIHQQRIESFPKHYPWIPSEALDYFKSRLVQAPRDVHHGLSIVKEHCTTAETQRQAFEALAFKLDMLWAMIDTIYNAYRED